MEIAVTQDNSSNNSNSNLSFSKYHQVNYLEVQPKLRRWRCDRGVIKIELNRSHGDKQHHSASIAMTM